MQQQGIHLANVTKSYAEGSGRRKILNNLHLKVEPGEFLSIAGPSGSGKSTLLNIISGIDTPDTGEVNVAGINLAELSESALTLFRRDNIGYVFQFFNLVPTLTVAENLQLPLRLKGVMHDDSLIRSALARFDLADRFDSYPDLLSGGEQQRVAVIRAAISQPGIVIADEPTGNLDESAGADVLTLLRSVVAGGTCVIMATHSATAAAAADRRLTMSNGSLTELD